jgi:SAM-dependent methyltransferase
MECRLCGSKVLTRGKEDVQDFEYDTPGCFGYYQCFQCGLLNINPIPNQVELNHAYPEAYHAYHEHHSPLSRQLKERFWGRKALRYSQYLNPMSRVLEAGCSFGDLLSAFQKRGVSHVQGLDFNIKAVTKARSRGLDVFQGELDTAELKDGSFDMIVMENFIEHVYDPVKTFQRCNQLLKPGGYLVGETPNTDSWDCKLFGRHWGGYHSPRHLYLFNIRSLRLLASRTGFGVVRISNLLQPAHWVLSVQNRFQDSPFKVRLTNGRSWYFGPLLLAAIPLNAIQMVVSQTSSVEFVFRKGLQAI